MIGSSEIEIWTTEDTSKFLRVTPDFVRSLARKRVIPHFRLTENGKILFTKSKVIEWFLSLEVEVKERQNLLDEEEQRNYIKQLLNSNK